MTMESSFKSLHYSFKKHMILELEHGSKIDSLDT